MKKLITLLVAVMLTVACVFGLTACGNEKKLKVVKYTLTEEKYAFAVNKGNTELMDKINSYLSTIKSNGVFDDIVTKYQDDDSAKFVGSPIGSGQPTNNDLVVLTNTPFGIFEYVGEDGKYYGIDMEIAKGLAQSMNKNLFIVEWLDFDTILNQFGTYPNAVVMAGLSIDNERAKIVEFSTEYFSAGQALIALNSDNTFDACKNADEVKSTLAGLKDKTIGFQNGTTAGGVLDNYKNVTPSGFKTATMAAQALVNGSIDYVLVDNSPAESIVNKLNKLN